MNENSVERRKHIRVDVSDIVRCVDFSEDNAGNPAEAKTRNISAGGILLESPRQYPVGETIKLEVGLSGWEDIRISLLDFLLGPRRKTLVVIGTVVRVECISDNIFFIGIAFTEMKKKKQKALEKYIKTITDHTSH